MTEPGTANGFLPERRQRRSALTTRRGPAVAGCHCARTREQLPGPASRQSLCQPQGAPSLKALRLSCPHRGGKHSLICACTRRPFTMTNTCPQPNPTQKTVLAAVGANVLTSNCRSFSGEGAFVSDKSSVVGARKPQRGRRSLYSVGHFLLIQRLIIGKAFTDTFFHQNVSAKNSRRFVVLGPEKEACLRAPGTARLAEGLPEQQGAFSCSPRMMLTFPGPGQLWPKTGNGRSGNRKWVRIFISASQFFKLLKCAHSALYKQPPKIQTFEIHLPGLT